MHSDKGLSDDGMTELIERLQAMPQAEPPTDLRAAIMDSVRASSGVGAFRRPARLAQRLFVGGWALAAAIILVFLVIARPRPDPHATATMAPLSTRFTSDTLTLEAGRNGPLVTLRVLSRRAGSITIRWDPKSADLVAISGAEATSSRKDQTTFTVVDPSQRAAVVLRPRPSVRSLDVRVLSENDEVIRAAVDLR